MNHPNDRKYANSHEWAYLDGDLVVTGISDHAQIALGDLVYVEAPDVGSHIQAGQAVGVVESVKTASDIHAPIDGEVVAINEALSDDPELVNSDPYGDGWIYKIRPARIADLDDLLSAEAYESSINA